MAVAIAVDMDAGAMAAEKMAARKPNPATNGLGSDGVDGLQRWATCRKKKLTTLCFEVSSIRETRSLQICSTRMRSRPDCCVCRVNGSDP